MVASSPGFSREIQGHSNILREDARRMETIPGSLPAPSCCLKQCHQLLAAKVWVQGKKQKGIPSQILYFCMLRNGSIPRMPSSF